MEERPNNVVVASTAALIGAFFAFVSAVLIGRGITDNSSVFNVFEIEGFEIKITFCILSVLLFIAVAGSLNKNGQWSWRFLIFMEVLCTAIPMLAYIFGAMDFTFCITLVIMACLSIIFTATHDTKRWVEDDRI